MKQLKLPPYSKNIFLIRFLLLFACLLSGTYIIAQPPALDDYNITWTSQSRNSSESMPVGGGDIGLNVWVENNELLIYFSRSGCFDENNAMLKNGRLRLRLNPSPFSNENFTQQLVLKNGNAVINTLKNGIKAIINIWVDVYNPAINIQIESNKTVTAEAIYENWRFADRLQKGKENNANSWKWASHVNVITYKDSVGYNGNDVVFYHHNKKPNVFDATVQQQGLAHVKDSIYNPLQNLCFGGVLTGRNFIKGTISEGNYINTKFKSWSLRSHAPSTKHLLQIHLYNAQTTDAYEWKNALYKNVKTYKADHKKTIAWWNAFWQRSYIFINNNVAAQMLAKNKKDDRYSTNHAVRRKADATYSTAGPIKKDSSEIWQAGRNYQLFRYMLACNAYSHWPTKFNGGLFTVDPIFTDSTITATPDHRNWGGGTFTAQNQRLVYWPLIKTGDHDMMLAQFDFYNRLLPTAMLRTQLYWGHKGANFNEQIENFGLPNPTEYGWKRPPGLDLGMEYNAWLEYEWDTVLEFCMMILETENYFANDIKRYMPLIENCIIFFDEHYQYLARERGSKALDENGKLIIYPGSGAETFKMAYNPASTIAALQTITKKILLLPKEYLSNAKRKYFSELLLRLPPLPFATLNNVTTIAPAKLWARVNNTESAMLYPVFPWGIYGIGRPGLDTAINTYLKDTFALKFRSHKGWKQDNIFAARLGLTDDALRLTTLKLKNSGRRFPAFWGPGFDWVPDHNWGGSGMIGLQETLLQAVDDSIHLFAAWPKNVDVHFKLHAPKNTIVEAALKQGKISLLKVTPVARRKDIILHIK